MKYDYHCHSTISDGSLTPDQLISRAHTFGVRQISLTDHDDFSGLKLARETAESCGINLINGVEISTTWYKKTIHILGYGFNCEDKTFYKNLEIMRNTRIERAVRIEAELTKLGFPNTLIGAQKIAGRDFPISRTHFARYLIKQGYCKNFPESMNKYLSDDAPAGVPHQWIDIPNAIEWIHNAGGVAFIAHPLRYKFPEGLDLIDLVKDFVSAGGDGLEVVYANHSPRQIEHLTEIAFKYNLGASGGSDFHSNDTSMGGVELGHIGQLPAKLIPLTRLIEKVK